MIRRISPGNYIFKYMKAHSAITLFPWLALYQSMTAYTYLKQHEDVHKAQMRRQGWIIFIVKYFYWLFKYGYYNNPYEVEARRISKISSGM